MPTAAERVQKTYLVLTFVATFAASVIRGIDALFLLDAGMSTEQVFTVYAFMTIGTVLFEIPTGAVADVRGRRLSYLIGALALAFGTLLYWLMWQVQAGFIWFALTTLVFGIAFTFFSGATEAWLVDALDATGFEGLLEDVFAKAQIATGVAMLTGTLLGGTLAQVTNLGVPYLLRAALLFVTFGYAFARMHDLGFEPAVGQGGLVNSIRQTTSDSIRFGFVIAPIRWMTLAGAFTFAAMGFIFYGMQPYLLELYGDETAYLVASLAATIVAGAQIIGGAASGWIRQHFRSRTGLLMATTALSALMVAVVGLVNTFWAAVTALIVWSVLVAVMFPVRQAYLNAQIDSKHRATVLSVDSLVASSGGVPSQPALGRVASQYGYSTAFVVTGALQLLAIPFLLLARRDCPPHTDSEDSEDVLAAA